jgi:F-type H+-transporting ATPase subunit b
VLKKFLYRPVLNVIAEHKETIANGLLNAEKIEQRLQNTQLESAEKLAEASKYAQSIISKASSTADQIVSDAHEKVKADIDIMMEKGKQSISIEREIMKNELREELAGLVILGIESVAGKILDESDQKNILARTIKSIEDNAA